MNKLLRKTQGGDVDGFRSTRQTDLMLYGSSVATKASRIAAQSNSIAMSGSISGQSTPNSRSVQLRPAPRTTREENGVEQASGQRKAEVTFNDVVAMSTTPRESTGNEESTDATYAKQSVPPRATKSPSQVPPYIVTDDRASKRPATLFSPKGSTSKGPSSPKDRSVAPTPQSPPGKISTAPAVSAVQSNSNQPNVRENTGYNFEGRQSYNMYTTAVKDPLISLLTEDEIASCQATFNRFDISGKGRVPFRALPTMVAQAANLQSGAISQAELDDRLAEIDVLESNSADRCVGVTDFLLLMGQRQRTERSERLVVNKEPVEETPNRGCIKYMCLYIFLFLAHWFGANRFDLDNDGDIDIDDVERFFNGDRKAIDKNFKVNKKAQKKQHKEKLEEETTIRTLQNILGRWLVGEPGLEFIVTVLDAGTCLYDGLHMGTENDVTETVNRLTADLLLKRNDGWTVNNTLSTPRMLVWEFPGYPNLVWQRVLSWAKVTSIKPFSGEWRLFEDGEEDTTVVTVDDEGMVFYDGAAVEGDELVLTPNPEGGNPELKRGVWTADLARSTGDSILWIQPSIDTRISWHRPPQDHHSANRKMSDMAFKAMDASEACVDILADILVSEVEGEAFETKEAQRIEEMFTKNQTRPKFIFIQVVLAIGLWLVCTFKLCFESDEFSWSKLVTQKAGLDPIHSAILGHTDLKLIDVNTCENYRFEVWRWLTYQFTHVGITHVLINSILTLLLGVPIEAMVGFVRTFLMFNAGVIGGALAYGVWDGRNTIVGMSGGCYALVAMHFAEIALNWKKMKFAKTKLVFLIVLVALDNVHYHLGNVKSQQPDDKPTTSNSAHFGGAMAGFVSGALIGYNEDLTRKDVTIKLLAVLSGGFMAISSTIWMWINEDPFPVWEWYRGVNVPTYWYQQIYNRRCLGDQWRCVRCKCSDDKCLDALRKSSQGAGGWYSCSVAQSECRYPWYRYSAIDRIQADDSLEFTSLVSYLGNMDHTCYTDFKLESTTTVSACTPA